MKSNQITERNGVTLLFVISMIVLFLLMGTTFVVVSNRFMQSAVRTSRLRTVGIENVNSGAGQRYVQQALFDLVRGPKLDNLSSPLRGHSLLGDMYGYGLEAHIRSISTENIFERPEENPTSATNPQFIRVTTIGLGSNGLDVTDAGNRSVVARRIFRTSDANDAVLSGPGLDGVVLSAAPGQFNGLLMTIVEGSAAGLTARVVDHQVFPQTDGSLEHVFMLSLVNSVSGITAENLENEVTAWEDDPDNATRVIINGRAFAGTGAGRFNSNSPFACQHMNPSDTTTPNPTLLPNRRFEPFDDFAANYLGFSDGTATAIPGNASATNESYDAYDYQNMFLSGNYYHAYQAAIDPDDPNTILDAMQFLVPSFHRRELAVLNGIMNNMPPASSDEIDRQARFSFRPEYFPAGGGNLDSRSTASSNFPNLFDGANPPNRFGFARRPLDVDNDGDGILDGVWMDIGLPTITLSNGRLVRPLVSYMVKDLDACANINVHSNRSHIASNNRFINQTESSDGIVNGMIPMQTSPSASQQIQGMGYGPAEIDLRRIFSNQVVTRLLAGQTGNGNAEVVIPGRYGFDPEEGRRRIAGGGPVPGFGGMNVAFGGEDLFGQDSLSAYKFFGWPNVGNELGGVLGGRFQSSPMDIYGRFRTDYSTAGGIVGMPIIDVGATSLTYSEIINNPYETTFAPPPVSSPADTLFSLNELERILRQNDFDAAGIPSRIATLASNFITEDFDRYAVTTDSWEVPTQFTSTVNSQQVTPSEMLYRILSQSNNGNPITDSASMVGVPNGTSNRELVVQANITGFVANNSSFIPDPLRRGMLSCDVRSGRPFNINRPFGNGLDDILIDENGDEIPRNGIVDEPSEYDLPNNVIPELILHPDGGEFSVDADGDGLVRRGVEEGIRVRQKFARDLYMLVLLTTELVDRDGDGQIFNNDGLLDNGDFSFNGGINAAARMEYRSMIAQWAINVADFRDPDSIMTPFEVDLNPFNGWDVDGDITSPESTNFRRVFWGVERPEVLITESIALHDRRTENLANDDGVGSMHDPTGMDPNSDDTDFDSRLVPQASAFFELYAPWIAPGNQIQPAEFDPDGNGGIDLAQMTPNGDVPVWRMLAVRSEQFAEADTEIGIELSALNPLRDPDGAESGAGSASQVLNDQAIKRYIYFNRPGAGVAGDPQFDGTLVYHPDPAAVGSNTAVVLQPGNYAVIGSAGQEFGSSYTTLLGRRADHVANTPVDIQGTRRIELEVTGDMDNPETNGEGVVRVYNAADIENAVESQPGTLVLPIVQSEDNDRSLGLTEPDDGYGNVQPNMTEGEGFIFPVVLDAPADKARQQDSDNPMDVDTPLYNQFLGQDQLASGAFVILLQRLADPTRDWDAETNPYRSVDSTGCDLFSFNGIDGSTEADNLVTGVPNSPEAVVYFGSYERRGGMESDAFSQNQNRSRLLWKTEYAGLQPSDPSPLVDNADDPHVLNTDFINSLGRLNANYETEAANQLDNANTPFAWLTWNNRPFVSGLELTNVPFTSSYFLTNRFDVSQRFADGNWNAYAGEAPDIGDDEDVNNGLRSLPHSGEFPHLLNFFASPAAGASGAAPVPSLSAIFDYVEVPSRYLGTENFVEPNNFAAATDSSLDLNSQLGFSLTRSFAPPFDSLSNFRAPGKVNINTITDFRVWNAVMGPYAANTPGGDTNGNGLQDENFMTNWVPQARFNPYRASNAFNWVPTAALVVQPSDCGLFRQGPASSTAFDSWPTTRPMFDEDQPFFDHEASVDGINDPFMNADRNAFYKNNKRNRLGNLVTGRSSTFAIWVTVGYFDVETVDSNNGPIQVLGAEATSDFGDTTRNRGFFIMDRSIPVAFEPGRNHNIEKVIRVSSFIE